jgi:hypothetical protein
MAGISPDEVRRLSAALAAEQRPPRIQRAVAKLLRGRAAPEGAWRIETPRGTLILQCVQSYPSSGRWSQGVERFELLRPEGQQPDGLIRKILSPEDDAGNANWLTEAMFYLAAAPRIECPGMSLPKLHGCTVEEERAILVMDYVASDPPPADSRTLVTKAARLAGTFGAWTMGAGLHELEWLRPEMPVIDPSALQSLEALAAACFEDKPLVHKLLGHLELTIGDPQRVSRMRAECYECLLHNDFKLRNIIPRDPSLNDLAVIDWGKVCRGMLGHDGVHLLLPAFLSSAESAETEDFGEAVRMVGSAVVEGAQSVNASLEQRRILLGLELALLFQTVVLVGKRGEGWLVKDAFRQEGRLKRRIASMLAFTTATAERLGQDFKT